MQDATDFHYKTVIRAILDGRLIPFLGAGANLCDRPEGVSWERGHYLPSGTELAQYLAERFSYQPTDDLTRVSQYIAVLGGGQGALYQALRNLLDVNYPPTLLHKLLAVLPRVLRDQGSPSGYQLIVTTNYDDVLERTFHASGEPFDLVSYVAEGKHRGKFWHWHYAPDSKQDEDQTHEAGDFWKRWPPKVEPRLIDKPNEYPDLSLEQCSVILKIHGAVDRVTPPEYEDRLDSFVITEDDYIDYLAHTDISNVIPIMLAKKMKKSNFLFLGYSLRDWNLRVILRRIWGEQGLRYNSWAIQLNSEELEERFWIRRDIEIINARLEAYVNELITRLQAGQAVADLEKRLSKPDSR